MGEQHALNMFVLQAVVIWSSKIVISPRKNYHYSVTSSYVGIIYVRSNQRTLA